MTESVGDSGQNGTPIAPRKPRTFVQRCKDWLFRPTLEWVQVEVNTDCDSQCVYCPRTVRGEAWPQRRMSMETFTAILPRRARANANRPPTLVHLQGWGEPFLNPFFFDMVDHARRGGYPVGTTSNGNLMDAALAERLVAAGLESVSFSLAGVDERNDKIRRGTSIERVMAAIAAVNEAKRRHATTRPAVTVAYMLLKSRLDDIERMPGFFRGIGVESVIVSTLGHVASPGLAREAVLPADEAEYRTLRERCDGAMKEAVGYGVTLHFMVPRPGPRTGFCGENVMRALVVSVDGTVSPCVLSRFPAEPGETGYADPFAFGRLAEDTLHDIWWSAPYARFRRAFYDGVPPERCRSCVKLGL